MRVETVYTEQEWMKHVEKHGKRILKRYIIRKFRNNIPFFIGVIVFYIVYAICFQIAIY